MIQRILVPLDGSEFAEHALPTALSIAERIGASIALARVHIPHTPALTSGEGGYDLAIDAAIRENDQEYLTETVKRLRAITKAPVNATLLDGAIADGLEAYVASAKCELVVMTTHGRGALSRFWLGSVSDQLVRRTSAPVLLLRPSDSKPDLKSPPLFDRILVPLDGSPLAEEVLEPAIELGSMAKARYSLLQVMEPVILADRKMGGNPMSGFDPLLTNQLHEKAKKYLEGVADRLKAQSLTVQTKVVTNRPAAAAILDEARSQNANLIALATHGRGGLRRMLLGSVADKVLRGSSVPILVYRAPLH